MRRTVFFDRSGHPASSAFRFLGYRLYEGWYNDYFTKQLAGQVQTGLDESAWADIRAKYPNVNFPEGMNPAYAALYAANQEMVGWLKIPNMKYIDFPIVQGKDNDKYLKLDYYGRTTSYGNPFLDFRNNIKELDRNTIIFGHHMRSGDQVFSELTDYLTIDGFKRNPVIEYNTLYADYQWKVYAVFLTNSKAEHDNGYIFNYIFTNLSSDDKFKEYISEIDQRKLYSTGVDIRPDDKILTLSTCIMIGMNSASWWSPAWSGRVRMRLLTPAWQRKMKTRVTRRFIMIKRESPTHTGMRKSGNPDDGEAAGLSGE